MKSDVYLKNIEKTIKKQMDWLDLEDEIERQLFLEEVMDLCRELRDKSIKRWCKNQK